MGLLETTPEEKNWTDLYVVAALMRGWSPARIRIWTQGIANAASRRERDRVFKSWKNRLEESK